MRSLMTLMYLEELQKSKINRIGLFGKRLSNNSIYMLSYNFPPSDFKGSYFKREDNRIGLHGIPYQYGNDNDYFAALREIDNLIGGKVNRNRIYLNELNRLNLTLLPEFLVDASALGPQKPMIAHPPEKDSAFSYIYPSYVIWKNDPSYDCFYNSPENIEIPKHVLRETTGHPSVRDGSRILATHRISHKWNTLAMLPMDRRNQRKR